MSTAKEKRHMGRVAALGCIACLNKGFEDTPACFHHIRSGNGMSQRNHNEGIPLCPVHHQHHGYGVSLHDGQQKWEEIHGTEKELLKQVRGMLK